MGRIPISVILIAGLYLVSGLVGLAYHAIELGGAPGYETFWILLLRLLAVIGGIFALRGANWARWLLVAWILYHIILSLNHSITEVLSHIVIFLLTVLALFSKKARAFFGKP